MKQTSFVYAKYWCKSLDDASLTQGGLEANDIRSWSKLPKQGVQYGQVGATLLEQYFQGLPDAQSTVDVVLRPLVFGISPLYKKPAGIHLPKNISPIITLAHLKRNGRVYPIKSFFARDLLEPVDGKTYTIGTLKNLDSFLRGCSHTLTPTFSSHKTQPSTSNAHSVNIQWAQYIQACEKALKSVCENWPGQTNIYTRLEHGYICKHSALRSKNESVQALYQDLAKHGDLDLPLFDSYTSEELQTKQPCLPLHAHFAKRLASPSNQLSYSTSQHNALSHILELKNGEILAVNCPAGTGTTTLLKAAIATQWAQAALEKTPPPISIAVSTNERSLQNIVDAFGKDLLTADNPFEGRWLPGLNDLNQRRSRHFQIPEFAQAESCDELFTVLESPEYFKRAQEGYLITAQLNYSQIKTEFVADVVDFLHEQLQIEVERLKQLENTWHGVKEVKQKSFTIFNDSPSKGIAEAEDSLTQAISEMKVFTDFSQRWKSHQEQDSKVLSTFLTLLPSYTDKQFKEAQQFLQHNSPPSISFDECENMSSIQEKINLLLEQKNEQLNVAQEHLNELQQISNTEKISSIDWAEAIIDLLAESGLSSVKNLSDADAAADRTIRFNIFQLTTHYWEGRWLLEMRKLIEQPSHEHNGFGSAESILKKWRHRMMIMPCMATTCHMLPELLQAENTQTLEQEYLFNSIDLLVVDQAGQISPDIAGASFTLAKKALVMGDTLQASPISALNRHSDTANLEYHNLAASGKQPEQEFLRLSSLGKTASLGNVMRIAQTVCKYHQEPRLAAGMFLTEQYTSYNEIIEYCNMLCYQNQLKAMRGNKASTSQQDEKNISALPAMGYLHVDGFSVKTESGSYKNLTEAHAIANWLSQRKIELELHYRKPLAEIIAITTPYIGQTHAIIHACQEKGLDASSCGETGKLIVGTARALQGSQHPIVIFSNVHSKHLTYVPVRRDANLLNVAASHAWDAFLLFADMDVLASALPTTPRGLLAQVLLANDANQIRLEPQPRADLIDAASSTLAVTTPTTLKLLQTPQEHNTYFESILTGKGQDILIALSALELCDLETSKAFQKMATAIERGASVNIYTDIPSLHLKNNVAAEPVKMSPDLARTIQMLKSINIPVHLVSKIYNMQLICDHNTYCVGSYHWLNPKERTLHASLPTSLAYFGSGLAKEIEIQKRSLRNKSIIAY